MHPTWIVADASVLWLGLRLVFSLGIILAMIGALAWAAKRGRGLGLGMGAAKGAIVVRAREQIGRNTTIALLEVGDKALLIGANEQAIEVLAEGVDLLPPEEPEAPSASEGAVSADDRTSSHTGPGGSVSPGMNMIEMLREWSVRRS